MLIIMLWSRSWKRSMRYWKQSWVMLAGRGRGCGGGIRNLRGWWSICKGSLGIRSVCMRIKSRKFLPKYVISRTLPVYGKIGIMNSRQLSTISKQSETTSKSTTLSKHNPLLSITLNSTIFITFLISPPTSSNLNWPHILLSPKSLYENHNDKTNWRAYLGLMIQQLLFFTDK